MIGGAGLSTMQHLDSGYPPTNLRTLSRSISLSTGLHSWLMGEEAVLLDLHGIRPHSQRICVTPRQECSGGQRDGFKRQARKERRGKERQRLIKTALFCIGGMRSLTAISSTLAHDVSVFIGETDKELLSRRE